MDTRMEIYYQGHLLDDDNDDDDDDDDALMGNNFELVLLSWI